MGRLAAVGDDGGMPSRREPSSDQILELMQEVAAEHILPRHRRLIGGRRRSEVARRLRDDRRPGSREGAHPRPRRDVSRGPDHRRGSVLRRSGARGRRPRAADHAFLIDPVDGTRNFVRGSADFAVMIAEVRSGRAVRAWILQPVHDHAYVAEEGAGAMCDGLAMPRRAGAATRPQGLASQRRLIGFDADATLSPIVYGAFAAGIDYPTRRHRSASISSSTRICIPGTTCRGRCCCARRVG